MQPIELNIVTRLITDILAAGYTLSVFDGEEATLDRSAEPALILASLCSTEYDTLRIHTPAGKAVGWAALIWGNGWDVISDWSDNMLTEHLVKGALTLSDDEALA